MNGQRIFSFIFVAIIVLVAVILLIQAGRFVFDSTGDEETSQEVVAQEEELLTIDDYIVAGAPATYINDGDIIANEVHHSVEIEVTPTLREIRIIEGYDGKIIERKRFKNNQSAYEAFMSALNFEGILLKQEPQYPTEDGVCPTGNRYTFTINSDGVDDDLRSWASSCSRKHGDFAGDRAGVRKLFEKQIPEYRDLVRGLNL